MKFISDVINLLETDRRKFNVISSGTGTGKTYFIANKFKKQMPWVKNVEILFIASRSLIVDQQSKVEGISKYDFSNIKFIKHWNGEEDSTDILESKGIQIMTYDKIIHILVTKNSEGLETLGKVKVIIFDECHVLFSDKFIKDIEMLKVWVRDMLDKGNKVIIGMTATPNILLFYQKQWGVTMNRLNNEVLVNYRASQLHCTDFKTIPYIITTKLEGKTLVLCYSISDCLKLKKELFNAFVLISKSNKQFTSEMRRVRDYIVEHESLPDTFVDDDGVEKELDVLITTSTFREGINLRECSGIKNIVCCFADELHITQFMGRCRYNIDNLVVADTYISADNYNKDSYLSKCRSSFRAFMKNKDNTSWFNNISHLIAHDVYDVKRFILNADEKRFIDYINKHWLVPKGITKKEELDKYKIYKEEDKDAIVRLVVDCKLLKLYYSQLTFNKVVVMMRENLGYTIESQRGIVNKRRHSYKLIIDFDDEKMMTKNGDAYDNGNL